MIVTRIVLDLSSLIKDNKISIPEIEVSKKKYDLLKIKYDNFIKNPPPVLHNR